MLAERACTHQFSVSQPWRWLHTTVYTIMKTLHPMRAAFCNLCAAIASGHNCPQICTLRFVSARVACERDELTMIVMEEPWCGHGWFEIGEVFFVVVVVARLFSIGVYSVCLFAVR